MIFHRASVSLLPVRWRFTGGQRSRANTGKSSSRLGLRALHREQLGTWAPRSISRAARASRLRQLPWSTESSSSLWAPRSPLDRIGIAVDVPKRRASYAQVCAPVVFEWIARYECENPKRIGELYRSWSGTSSSHRSREAGASHWELKCPAVSAKCV